jgi:hypothetical protein
MYSGDKYIGYKKNIYIFHSTSALSGAQKWTALKFNK